ncbi:hypothetical protein ANCDUO_05040 [Ancylostoma duodenale]|uniref:Uncharacterized protein n=1 Tax=Ancylostoma duodenale TaxID=51022 RepID=A0A0C2DPQ6_9BILA|nr:hypothetical protein ANCDUO_05040 [Ancylostoma duodenale]
MILACEASIESYTPSESNRAVAPKYELHTCGAERGNTWDCNIEQQAWMQSCEDNPKLPPDPQPNPPVAPYARLATK